MPALQSYGGGGDGGAMSGASRFDVDLRAEVERLRGDVYALNELFEDLRVKYNVHTHVENMAPAYVQNAVTVAPPVESQSLVGLTTG